MREKKLLLKKTTTTTKKSNGLMTLETSQNKHKDRATPITSTNLIP